MYDRVDVLKHKARESSENMYERQDMPLLHGLGRCKKAGGFSTTLIDGTKNIASSASPVSFNQYFGSYVTSERKTMPYPAMRTSQTTYRYCDISINIEEHQSIACHGRDDWVEVTSRDKKVSNLSDIHRFEETKSTGLIYNVQPRNILLNWLSDKIVCDAATTA